VFVNVETRDGTEGLAAAKKLAPVLAREFQAMGPDVIRSVDWNVAPIRDWYLAHWPLFGSLEELTQARDSLREEIRKRRIEANPLAVELDDDDAPAAPQKLEGRAAEWLDPT
jgi:hypothetical protein